MTGKAEITIRRLIKRVCNQNNPETLQMISQEKSPSGYKYRINTEFMLKEFKMDYLLTHQENTQKDTPDNQTTKRMRNQEHNQHPKEAEPSEKKADQVSTQEKEMTITLLKETIGILREQLKIKDTQLNEKHLENRELIRGNREAIATVNVLTKQLQLSEGNHQQEAEKSSDDAGEGDIVMAPETREHENEKGSEVLKRKGFFRLFT